MDYRDNRQRWAESHQVVHFYAGQWCTFTPALTNAVQRDLALGWDPAVKVLWAHAGMHEPPEVVGAHLDRYPRLWTELSFRAAAVAPGRRLRALFERQWRLRPGLPVAKAIK